MDTVTSSPVLVTGGTGFIAGHIIYNLLERGYKVRTTVRNLENEASYSYLKHLQGADEQLEIVQADLTDAASLNKAFVGGVQFVFHVASPYVLKPDNPEEALVPAAVNGTKTVLELCQATKTVQKLVLTSCTCALSDEFDNNKEYQEDDWNTTSSLTRNSYAYSKTMAENLAWTFSKRPDCSFKLVTILPGMVWGPHIGGEGRISWSHRFLLAFLTKKIQVLINFSFNITDVRDVALAHILAMEDAKISGRYCLCHKAMHLSAILQVIHENFHDVKVPSRKVTDFAVKLLVRSDNSFRGEFVRHNVGRVPNISSFRARDVGMTLRPQVQTITDTVRYFMDNFLLEETAPMSCTIA